MGGSPGLRLRIPRRRLMACLVTGLSKMPRRAVTMARVPSSMLNSLRNRKGMTTALGVKPDGIGLSCRIHEIKYDREQKSVNECFVGIRAMDGL